MDNQAMFTAQQMQYNKMYAAGIDPTARWEYTVQAPCTLRMRLLYTVNVYSLNTVQYGRQI
jgi:hypothetical protein